MSCIKYLGVFLNSQLNLNDHVHHVVLKCNRMLGLISRMSAGISSPALLALYKSLVLPMLDYGGPAWMAYTNENIDMLEHIQRRATRVILTQRRQEMPYDQRLHHLKWHTLKSRRFLCG